MNNLFKRAVMMPFLFILVATVGVTAQSSNAGSNQTQGQNQTNTILFTAQNETFPTLGNETLQSTLSELIPANETDQSAISEQIQNLTHTNQTSTQNFTNASLTSSMEKIRAELAKLPENTSESEVINLQKKLLAASPFGPAILDRTYRVTVTFNSITIHDDHDHDSYLTSPFGAESGGGEWTLIGYVQGLPISLVHSTRDDGDTINYGSAREVTVDLPESKPISILTIGDEQDRPFIPGAGFCPTGTPKVPDPQIVQILDGPPSEWFNALHDLQVRQSGWCDQKLGYINKIYDPPSYGEGAHTNVVSSTGDFTLRYTITVVPPPISGEIEPGLDCKDDLGVNRATASSIQNLQFGPEDTIDNNPSTYWMSTLSLNPSITLDLGAQRILCQIKIAWQDGDSHPYRFNVAVSKNGITYTNVFSGMSSGNTINPELYGLGESDARYVKITVTQSISGSPNSMAKISEIDVLGRFTGNEPGQPTEGPVIR